jgi:outer membrane protein
MMVRKTIFLLALGVVLAVGTAADNEPVKIAVVDLDQALNSTEEGKSAREEITRKQRDAQAKLQPQIEKFKQMEEELKSKKFVLSEEALYQKQLDLLELKNEIDSQGKELEGKLKLDLERLVAPLRKKMVEIVQGIGRDQGYTLIVERGTPGLLYAREALDVTDTVVAQFNKKKD